MHIWATDEEDLVLAYLAAIPVQHTVFDAVFIAGDEEQKEINLSKARRLLGWNFHCGQNAAALVKIVGTLITAGTPASAARCKAGQISSGLVTSSP